MSVVLGDGSTYNVTVDRNIVRASGGATMVAEESKVREKVLDVSGVA